MPDEEPLALPYEILQDLVSWLQAAHVRGIVIGGIAASLLSRPRITRDIDVVVLLGEKNPKEFLQQGAQFGFVPRITDAAGFAQQSRVLLVRHQASSIDVDISLGALTFEKEMIARAVPVDVGGVSLPLPTPEDLIIMKAVAHRPRDAADIEALLDSHPKLDLERVRSWVREFAAALELPEILNDLEALLAEMGRHQS